MGFRVKLRCHRLGSGVLLFGMTLLLSGRCLAATDFGVRTGVYTDSDAGFVGAEAITPVSQSWYFNPNLEYAFADRGSLVAVSGDFHYDLVEGRPYYVWVGAGPALILGDTEPGMRHSDLGVNVVAGVGFRRRSVTPYLQTKVTLADDDRAVIAVGVRF